MSPSSGLLSTSASLAPTDDPIGSGSNLPLPVLITATVSAGLSTLLSLWTVWLQLKHYHRPRLQRMVVRILVMVPIYSISSLISLYSLDAAFFLDAFRDVYEAFVIYCFFSLLVEYLGGERSLLITLHGRPPHPHPRPVGWFLSPMDASDPFTFLGLKRGILQYVQLKPFLAALTVVLKATGTYDDGHLAKDSGYTYVSIAYNLSVSLSLYCLALFWVATNRDLKPFRPMPKFLCVKGIIFFSFWQGFAVSILVALGWIHSYRYETEKLSLAIQDTLICLEMPLFAFGHLYAFSYTDYIDENHIYSGRLPVWHAFRDAFGYKDLVLDSLTTLRGTGFSYRTFEPASGALHAPGLVRDRRIAAGLRYSASGKTKYWLDRPRSGTRHDEGYGRQGLAAGLATRPVLEVKRRLERKVEEREGYAPGAHEEPVHVDPALEEEEAGEDALEGFVPGEGERERRRRQRHWWERDGYESLSEGSDEEGSIDFHGPPEEDEDAEADEEVRREREREWKEMERLYREAKELEYGDWKYPVIDASRETKRRRLRDEEDALLGGRFSRKGKGKDRPAAQHRPGSYGALAERQRRASPTPSRSSSFRRDKSGTASPSDPPTSRDHPPAIGSSIVHASKHALSAVLPFTLSRSSSSRSQPSPAPSPGLAGPRPDAVDLVVADHAAEEAEQIRQRRRGEPSNGRTRVYRVAYPGSAGEGAALEEGRAVPDPVEGERAEVRRVSPTRGVVGEEEGAEEEGEVKITVTEEEQIARQAGVDEDSDEERERDEAAPSPAVEEDDNPWK
ncbi:hypothetical protein JCM10207_007260 [Rhodosporidiobolus poonsookiae]